MIQLGTFGVIMKFAINLESDALEFYKTCRENIDNKEIDELFTQIINDADKRLKILERVRRENVTEMILEPIKDLDSDPFQIEPFLLHDPSDSKICEIAVRNERRRLDFFEVAAEKIEFLIEASTAFERLADENREYLELMIKYT